MTIFGWINNIRENNRKTMNKSGQQCHKCNHYSYSFMGGGLVKLEQCRRYHKEYLDNCPDFELFCLSDWDTCIYDKNGRYEP